MTLLYIHIPFCDSKCHYCSFNSYVDKFELKSAYMEALKLQLQADLGRFEIGPGDIFSVFIGGGTPSTIDPALYEPIFKELWPYLQKGAEITTEANPNSATSSWLCSMKALGVNRISFGVQSFFDDKLKLLGRAHRAKDAIDAIENAKNAGFERISIDLIYATSLDTPKRVEAEIAMAHKLPITHLSAYELIIEEGTPFEKSPNVKKESIEQSRRVIQSAKDAGLEQYEISNFGDPCRHNVGYWEYRPYLGIGSGAVGRIEKERHYPHRILEEYIENPHFKKIETLTDEEILEEKIFLGLRSDVGVDEKILPAQMLQRAYLLAKEGKLRTREGGFYNPDYLLSDEIALFMLG